MPESPIALSQEHITPFQKWWRKRMLDPEFVKAQREKKKRAYRSDPSKFNARNRAYVSANKAKVCETQKRYRLANVEKRKENLKRWMAKNKHTAQFKFKKLLKSRREWELNKDKLKRNHKAWRLKHPALCRHYKHEYRAKQLRAKVSNLELIKEWIAFVRSKPKVVCYYCQKTVTTKGITFDHIVALNNGGSHSVENLCVSCKSCNSSKSDTPLESWYKLGQQVLAL